MSFDLGKAGSIGRIAAQAPSQRFCQRAWEEGGQRCAFRALLWPRWRPLGKSLNGGKAQSPNVPGYSQP